MQNSTLAFHGLIASVMLWGSANPAWAQGNSAASNKPSKCVAIPVQVTFYPVQPDTSNGGLYGATNDEAWTYTDGAGGVYAKFSCGWELFLNLQNTSPLTPFKANFSKLLVPGDVSGPTGELSGWLLHVKNIADLTKYSGGQLSTASWLSLERSGPVVGSNGSLFYCNDPVTFECGASGTLANKDSNTSLVRATVAPYCASWTIEPLPLSAPHFPAAETVAGLVKATTLKGRTSVRSAGQYSMPFTIIVTRTDGGGCNGLPQ